MRIGRHLGVHHIPSRVLHYAGFFPCSVRPPSGNGRRAVNLEKTGGGVPRPGPARGAVYGWAPFSRFS